MLSDALVGTWWLGQLDEVPLARAQCDQWILCADGTAILTHLGPGRWAYGDGHLTIEPRYLRRARQRARSSRARLRLPPPPRYEVVHLSGDMLQLRYAPDEPTRQGLFGPAIRRLAPEAP